MCHCEIRFLQVKLYKLVRISNHNDHLKPEDQLYWGSSGDDAVAGMIDE